MARSGAYASQHSLDPFDMASRSSCVVACPLSILSTSLQPPKEIKTRVMDAARVGGSAPITIGFGGRDNGSRGGGGEGRGSGGGTRVGFRKGWGFFRDGGRGEGGLIIGHHNPHPLVLRGRGWSPPCCCVCCGLRSCSRWCCWSCCCCHEQLLHQAGSGKTRQVKKIPHR